MMYQTDVGTHGRYDQCIINITYGTAELVIVLQLMSLVFEKTKI